MELCSNCELFKCPIYLFNSHLMKYGIDYTICKECGIICNYCNTPKLRRLSWYCRECNKRICSECIYGTKYPHTFCDICDFVCCYNRIYYCSRCEKEICNVCKKKHKC